MTTQPAPYPADTRAKGWRFELDHERIRQSDTWALAAPEIRPWLLMLWMVAWEQTPCGSMPSDAGLIAARVGMSRRTFDKHKAVLLRGWQQADDGRLYHPVLTERVRELLEYRDAAAKRKADYRAKMVAERAVPQASHVSPAGQTVESRETNATGTGTGTGTLEEKEKEKPARKRADPVSTIARPEDVSEQVWADWLRLRREKRAAVTPTVLDHARIEAGRAALPLERFLAIWCARGSQGLQADWLRPNERSGATNGAKSFRERDAELAAAEVARWGGGRIAARPVKAFAETIEMEPTHGRLDHD